MVKFPLDFSDFSPDCSVAAAVLGAGAISAGASIWGANKASDAQVSSTNAAIANQNQTRTMNQNLLQPFINAGSGAIGGLQDWLNPSGGASGNNPLSALLKLTMPGSNQTEALSQTPGYQFAEDKGLRAVNNQLAARGLGGSPGAVSKGAGDYVTGLASNTWQSVVNSLQNLFGSGAGALQNLVGTGVQAGGAVAGSNTAAGNNISNSLIGQGNAQAGAATATGSAIGGFGNSLSTAAILQKLLGNGAGGNEAYGGVAGGIYGGSGAAPLPGLSAADYGPGF